MGISSTDPGRPAPTRSLVPSGTRWPIPWVGSGAVEVDRALGCSDVELQQFTAKPLGKMVSP